MKWRSIQALRGIAVLAVVAYHAVAVERKYSGGDRLLPDLLQFAETGVDLFFVISGFVMTTVTRGRFGSLPEIVRFLWSRVTRIYPTYWFYFLITLAIFLVKPAWVNASQGNDAHLLASFVLWPTQQLPLVMVGWSLIHELWFYLVFAVLLLFPQRWLLPALLVWGLLVVTAAFMTEPRALSPAMRIVVHPYTLEFLFGAVAAWLFHEHRLHALPSTAIWIVVAATVVVGLPLVLQADILAHHSDLLRATAFGVAYAVLVLGAALLEQRGQLRVPRPLQAIGDMSYTVYLSHILVLSALGRLWSLTGPDGASSVDNGIAVPLMFAAVLAYGWIAYRLVERPSVDWSHRLRARWIDARARRADSTGTAPAN